MGTHAFTFARRDGRITSPLTTFWARGEPSSGRSNASAQPIGSDASLPKALRGVMGHVFPAR